MPTIKAPMPDIPLPIDPILPELKSTLRERLSAVLVAPPGAGKTTRVPIALADEDWVRGRKILVLEPRRIAARAAASRMASNIGQALGERVGLRVRFGSAISARTQIEIVTEGVFTRAILADPMLDGVAAILFDEFHERSLDADLGLALALDAQSGLRDHLKILVMSATLDDARIATLLGKAPIIRGEGRAYPVKTHYLGRDARTPIERQIADAAMRALRAEQGSMLIFLPGSGEIRRTERLLREAVTDPDVDITPLYGALDAAEQDRAIAPALAGRRKIVLATSIAETSITIEGVRIVIDCGLSRVPRYEVDAGLTRLETVRVSRAAADQRRGRAGRTEPGMCYRLWDEPQTAALEAYSRPEILSADLSSLALDLAQWGVTDPATLSFLDSPPRAAFEQARALLRELGALDAEHRITERGRELSRLPLPPRLAVMVADAASRGAAWKAAELALLVTERGLGGDNVDLTHRLDAFRHDRSRRADDARRMARRWADMIAPPYEAGDEATPGLLLARAFPDRIAKNRGDGAFTFANGRGANIELASPLARAPFLVVADVAGSAAQARIVSAAPIDLSEIEQLFTSEIETRIETTFDVDTRSLRARRVRRFKAILLADHPASVPGDEAAARALAEGIRKVGLERLPWSKPLKQWRERVIFLHRIDPTTWPDLSTEALHAEIDHWLAPALIAKTSLSQIAAEEFSTALRALLPWPLRQRLEGDAPSHFKAPSGSEIPIDYESEDGPKLSVRLQEMFGLDQHPTVAGGRVRILIELTSPAQRPIQLTRDLPGFWRGSYAAVRSDMRGRYPKHPWPDDPLSAPATRRAKPRGT